MSYPYLVLGLLLLLLAVVDALWTALWVDGGAGPVSSRLSTWAWRGLLALVGRRHHHALSLFGPAMVTTIVLTWVLLLWAGWVFVFASEPGSLMSTRDDAPADWSGRIFFVAYSMFTMGNGDFSPNGDAWQVIASLTNGSGMLLVTLAVTYILSVVSAVVQKRAFASQVAGLGRSADELVTSAWAGRDLRSLDLALSSLSSQLSVLTEQYLAYPVLQYYHAARPEKSPAIALAVLDEALTLLRFGVSQAARPDAVALGSARSAVASFLETLQSAFIEPADEPPPPPGLAALRQAGIPTVEERSFQEALSGERARRRKLLGLVHSDGWGWPERER